MPSKIVFATLNRNKVDCFTHGKEQLFTQCTLCYIYLKFLFKVQQRAKQTDFLPSYDVKLVVFKRMWGLLNCCHALGMYKYQNH